MILRINSVYVFENIRYNKQVLHLLVWMVSHIHFHNLHRLPCAFLVVFSQTAFSS